MEKIQETYSYKGWLNSDSFIKRSLAVLGYGMVGQLIISAIILVIGLIFGGIGMLFIN